MALGNLDARRDFGYAPEYVAALAAMAAREQGDDYVLATGHAASVRDFATAAFAAAGIDLDWQGEGAAEVALDRAHGMPASASIRVCSDRSTHRCWSAMPARRAPRSASPRVSASPN